MPSTASAASVAVPAASALPRALPRALVRTGGVISGFVSLFYLFDGGARLAHFAPYIDGLVQAGYPAATAPWIGLALIVSTLLYVYPRTAVLGAVLVTGYLGGATATQVRIGDAWFWFPVVFGVLTWGGLWLREPRLRALLPLRGGR